MRKKRKKEVKGLKRNHRYTQTLIADTLTCSGKLFPRVSSVKGSLCIQYCYLIFQRQNCILNLGRLGLHVFMF